MMFCMQTDSRYTERIKEDVKQHVLSEGEAIFLPVTERIWKIDGQWQRVLVPLFKGYLFICSDDPTGLYVRIHSALGKTIFRFVKLLKDDEYVIPLSEADECLVKELSDEDHVIKASLGYMKGDMLIVTDGPLKGHEGQVVKINRHKRIAILSVEFLGEKRNITVGLEVVKKVNSEEKS